MVKFLFCLLLLLVPVQAFAANGNGGGAEVTWSHVLWREGTFEARGCAGSPATPVRPGFVEHVMRRYWDLNRNAGLPLVGILGQPPDEDTAKWAVDYRDILALIVRDFRHAPVKPDVIIGVRSDVHQPHQLSNVGSGNPRTHTGPAGCDPDSNNHLIGSSRDCKPWPSVPMCRGGTGARLNMWCPLHEGVVINNCGDGGTAGDCCPGTSTCQLVEFDPAWIATVDTQTHAEHISGWEQFVWHDDINACDGTEVTRGKDCGTGYPLFEGVGESPNNLPDGTIGKALYGIQGTWPLTSRPRYYMNEPIRACIGGDNAGKSCPLNNCNVGVPPGTCPPLTCVGGSNQGAVCTLGSEECLDGGYCGAYTTAYANGYVVDLRIPEAQDWSAAQHLDSIYQSFKFAGATDGEIQTWPVRASGVVHKNAWWRRYELSRYPGDSPYCQSSIISNTGMWIGPTRPGAPWHKDCLGESFGGPSHDNHYGLGEYEEATAAVALKILKQTTNLDMCSDSSRNPYQICTSSSQCSGGTCVASPGSAFFRNVEVGGVWNPAFRETWGQMGTVKLNVNSRWVGASSGPRHGSVSNPGINDPPFQPLCSGGSEPLTSCSVDADCAGGGTCVKGLLENACPTNVIANAGGPYTLSANGGKVRLEGSCVGPYDVTPAWTIIGDNAGCLFVDPFFETKICSPASSNPGATCTVDGNCTGGGTCIQTTAHPQTMLKGCTATGTIKVQLACNAVTSMAPVTIPAP